MKKVEELRYCVLCHRLLDPDRELVTCRQCAEHRRQDDEERELQRR